MEHVLFGMEDTVLKMHHRVERLEFGSFTFGALMLIVKILDSRLLDSNLSTSHMMIFIIQGSRRVFIGPDQESTPSMETTF